MDRPLIIGNVHNMSLESWIDESDEYPHLVAQFTCVMEGVECFFTDFCHTDDYITSQCHFLQVCCAAVWLHDVYNVNVKGISITAQTSYSSVVYLKNVSGTTVQLNTTCSPTNMYESSMGIAIYEATSIEVHSSSANNCSAGLVLFNTTNTNITKVTAMYNQFMGICFDTGIDTNINNTIAAHNAWFGVTLSTMINTHINTITAHNDRNGMRILTMNDTHITNVTATDNGWYGIVLAESNNIYMTKTVATHNGHDIGIFGALHTARGQILIIYTTNTHIVNTSFTDVSAQSTSSTVYNTASLLAIIALLR